MKNRHLGATATLVALLAVTGAQAQTRHSAAARSAPAASTSTPAGSTTPLTQGPTIPGLCIFSNTGVIQGSTVGKAYLQRMQQLRSQAAAEVGAQQTSLQSDEKALVGRRATLSPEQFAKEAQPMQQREQQLNVTAEQRTRDLQYTAAHQQQRLAAAIQPLATQVYEAHHCSVLLNGDSAIMAASSTMDLTSEVTAALNSRMSTITFDRETAPQQ